MPTSLAEPTITTRTPTSSVGLFRSFARRWERSASACLLVPFVRFITGRIPTITEYQFPFIAVIPGSSYQNHRSDRAELSRRVLSFHVWVDVARLEEGEQIAEMARSLYANEAWDYSFGRVIDVIDGGPANAKQINDPTYQCWELVKLFTLCIQQSRLDVTCQAGCVPEASSGSRSESSISRGSFAKSHSSSR